MMFWTEIIKRLSPIFQKKESVPFSTPKRHPMDRSWIRWLIAVSLTVILVLMFPSNHAMQFSDFKEGSVSPRRIVAPFSFEILKTSEEYQLDREQARKEVKPVFNHDQGIIRIQIDHLDDFFRQLSISRNVIRNHNRIRSSVQDSLRKGYDLTGLDSKTWNHLLDPELGISDEALGILREKIKRLLRDLMAIGILNQDKSRITVPDKHIIIHGQDEVIHSIDEFIDLPEAYNQAMKRMSGEFKNNAVLVQTGYQLSTSFLIPNMILDETTYNQSVDEALARVPLSRGFVIDQEKIVDKNERITPEIRKKLVSLSVKTAELNAEQGGIRRLLPYLGKACFVIAFLFLFSVYIILKSRSIIHNTKLVFLLSLIIGMVAASTYFISKVLQQEDMTVPFITTAVGTMLFAMIFDEKIGFVGSAVLSVLIGGILGNDFNVMVISFFTGVVGIIAVKRLRNRSQLFQATLLMIGAYIFILSATGLMRYASGEELLGQLKIAVMNGIVTPFLAYLILSIFERLFDITTDYRLLELSNLSHKLMKRLSVEATGTYHHSIQVGNLAEVAAQAVGANSLLARVGSYYHDIGKLEKAEYFIENQRAGENPHQKLTPRMSALILSNHVKRSLELADQYALPSTIKDIMVQHHGTTTMVYFYSKALSKKKSDDVNINDYKYTGPKPQTKEAAIVMLADSIEAATRSLKNPTHSRLKGVVEDLVDERFKEGELDESPLTLRDLERIKDAFLKILAGIYHARIEYPDPAKNKDTYEAGETA